MLNGRRQPSRGGTSRMTRECQVRICERLGVKFPGATRQERTSHVTWPMSAADGSSDCKEKRHFALLTLSAIGSRFCCVAPYRIPNNDMLECDPRTGDSTCSGANWHRAAPERAHREWAMGLVSRVSPVQTALRNCTRDEGRSFEVGNQVLISSHRKLLLSKAMVVNVAETSGLDSDRQG